MLLPVLDFDPAIRVLDPLFGFVGALRAFCRTQISCNSQRFNYQLEVVVKYVRTESS